MVVHRGPGPSNLCRLPVGRNAHLEHPVHITPGGEASASETHNARSNLFKTLPQGRASNEVLVLPFLQNHTFSPKGVAGLSFTARIGRLSSFQMIFPSALVFRFWKGTHLGLGAAVERGPSQGARSGSTEPRWTPFPSFSPCAFSGQEGWPGGSLSPLSTRAFSFPHMGSPYDSRDLASFAHRGTVDRASLSA